MGTTRYRSNSLKINSHLSAGYDFGAVGELPHVRVGHRQALIWRKPFPKGSGFFYGETPRLLMYCWLVASPVMIGPLAMLGFSNDGETDEEQAN